MGSLHGLALAALTASVIALAPAAHAQTAGAPSANDASVDTRSANPDAPAKITREYLIKAAILYNLAKFTAWPETAFHNTNAPLRVCVLGNDPPRPGTP